jgi:hypothetical protein
MVRLLLLVVVLAGCGGASTHGPAWPAPSTTAEDGGESIAPKNTELAAIADKPSPVATPVAADEEATPTAESAEVKTSPKTSPAGVETPDAADDDSATDDTLTIHDEIVIEIDDE